MIVKIKKILFAILGVLFLSVFCVQLVQAEQISSKFNNFSFNVSEGWTVSLHKDFNQEGAEFEYIEIVSKARGKSGSSLAMLNVMVVEKRNNLPLEDAYRKGLDANKRRGIDLIKQEAISKDDVKGYWYIADYGQIDNRLKSYMYDKGITRVVLKLFVESNYFDQYEHFVDDLFDSLTINN